jgi:hypothetical protein
MPGITIPSSQICLHFTAGDGGGWEREGQVEVVEKEEGVREERRGRGADRNPISKVTCKSQNTTQVQGHNTLLVLDQRFIHMSTCDTPQRSIHAPANQGHTQVVQPRCTAIQGFQQPQTSSP